MPLKRLKEFIEEKSDYLVIRTTNAWLLKEEQKKILQVEIDEDSEIITNNKEGFAQFQNIQPEWFQNQLVYWNKLRVSKVRIASPEYPLNVLLANICLVLVIEGKEYLLSFYRDISLQGWNMPGGCPKNLEEIFSPRAVAIRETCEEVLLGDANGRFYFFGFSKVEIEHGLDAWDLKPKEIVSLSPKELSFGKGDAQNLVLEMPDRETRIENIVLTIDPYYALFWITLYWRLTLPIKLSELRIFDGEQKRDGSLLNRVVRLTTKDGEIAAMFVYGQNIFSADWSNPAIKKQVSIGDL